MRKLAATCIFVLICAVGFAQMQAGTIGPRPVPVNQGGTGEDDTAGARTNLNVYSVEEVDQAVAAGQLLFYRTASASDVSGMYRFATSSADAAFSVEYSSATSNITTNGTYYLISQVITPAGYPGITNLRPGIYSGMTYCYINTGNRDLKLEAELWICDSAGTEKTFVATSSEEDIPASVSGVAWHFDVPSAQTMLVTDRLLVKFYVESQSGTTNTQATFVTGGSKTGYFGIDISNDLIVTLNTPQSLTNKTLSNDTTVFNGSSSQTFAGSTGTFGTLVNTPIIDTPSAAPLVLRCSGTAIVTVDDGDGFCATSARSVPGASQAITMTDAGVVTLPNQSYVYATGTVNALHSTGCVATFTSEVTDRFGELGGGDTGNGRFTAAVSGLYLFTCAISFPANADVNYRQAYFRKASTSQNFAITTQAGNNSGTIGMDFTLTGCAYLAAGDYVTLNLYQTSGVNMAVPLILTVAKIQ